MLKRFESSNISTHRSEADDKSTIFEGILSTLAAEENTTNETSTQYTTESIVI